MSHCKLRTPLPIHFKLRIVIGIDSLMVCILFGGISVFSFQIYNIYVEIKHYNSLSPITLEWKIEISPKSIDRKTINSNNCVKFEVNWPRGSQFTARHTISQSYWNWWSYGLYTLWWNFEFSFQSYGTLFIKLYMILIDISDHIMTFDI
jgi:hypothetical protein